MGKTVFRLTGRNIKSYFGRYMALLLIVFLSIGFFAGLKVTQKAMYQALEDYGKNQTMHDFRVISTLGWKESDEEDFASLEDIAKAEGFKSQELNLFYGDETKKYLVMSIGQQVDLPSLEAGRMPESPGECLADARVFTDEDLGKQITLQEEEESTLSLGSYMEEDSFTIVGLAESPIYINHSMGSGSGGGEIVGYIMVQEEAFSENLPYSWISLSAEESQNYAIYSEEYDEYIEEIEDKVEAKAEYLAERSYTQSVQNFLMVTEPGVYVLGRDSNEGYVSFESDTSIITGIADLFPLFFLMVAILICVTTIERMVEEQRMQIGTLKALGYSDGAVTSIYLLYAGSAVFVGWILGFFLGTYSLPKLFWTAYGNIYSFTKIPYYFDPLLGILTLVIAMAAMLLTALLSSMYALRSQPAELILPAPPKAGKRIFLERIRPLWNRLSFLRKVVLRNMFRYKKRFILMLIGISCCTALVVVAFGVRDSFIDIGSMQYGGSSTILFAPHGKEYEGVQKYEYQINIASGSSGRIQNGIKELEPEAETLAGYTLTIKTAAGG